MSNYTYTKKIGGDSIVLFLIFQVEWETVMTHFFKFLNIAIWQASRPTVIYLGVWERHSQIEGSSSRVSEGIDDLIEASNAFWLLTFHFFVHYAHESLEFSHFCSRLPFWVFILELCFFIVSSCTQKFKIHPKWVNDLST